MATQGGNFIQQNPSTGLYEVFENNRRISTTSSKTAAETDLARIGSGPISLPSISIPVKTATITSENASPQQAIKIPSVPAPTTNYDGSIARGQGAIGAYTTGLTPSQTTNEFAQQLSNILGETPSSADEYVKAQEQVEIKARQQQFLEQQQRVRAAQAESAGVKAEIQSVIDSGKAKLLKIEQQSEQRGIPTEILSRQQAEINRQTAIEVLPLQSKALAAQAKVASVQGDLTTAQSALSLAQEQLDTVFKLKLEDSKFKYDKKKTLLNAIVDFADKREQRLIKEQEQKNASQLRSAEDAINDAQSISSQARSFGDFDTASEIAKLRHPDIDSPTFKQDLQKYQSDVATLQGRIKKAAVKTDITASAGSLEEFVTLTGRRPASVEELNTFTRSRTGAGRAPQRTPTANTITFDEAQKRGLPLSIVGQSEAEIAQSFTSETPPQWFVDKANNEAKSSLLPQTVDNLWSTYRERFLKGEAEKQDKEIAKARAYFKGTYGEAVDDTTIQTLAERVKLYVNGGMSYAEAIKAVIEEASE